jgi:hypothetical protein
MSGAGWFIRIPTEIVIVSAAETNTTFRHREQTGGVLTAIVSAA